MEDLVVMVGTDLALGLADPADLALEGVGHTDLALGLAGRRLGAAMVVRMDPALVGRRLGLVLAVHMGLVLGLEDLVLVVLVPAGRTVTWA